eukprot:SAG11_NODE_78_length_17939_cov_10.236883_16_plen_167_part_00
MAPRLPSALSACSQLSCSRVALVRAFSTSPTKNGAPISGPPDAQLAASLQREYYEFSNESLTVMAATGDQDANEEILIREVMHVDGLDWATAKETVVKIGDENRKLRWLITLPPVTGICIFFTSAVVSIPMIFDKNMAIWFNNNYVTSPQPDPEDLETWLEIGIWT